MPIKIFVIVAFLAILVSLGSALFHLVRHKSDEDSRKTAKALTFRIGLSLGLFILLVLALAAGLIQPHGLGARMHADQKPASSAPQNPGR
ncbi:twin transmembrane helix small protein [Methylomonas sp. MS20]|uniref:twin transmembrane helix small protein n=1 Tax=unclassified Methylomonas TaxID=2608980 RepID=UPI0028A46BEE|nr:twin transmembrane helix small protein [Methylomonas sp. MV1]MDT4331682.1 twin transmembrane helix small protein [Methylomonas sp. MV1]